VSLFTFISNGGVPTEVSTVMSIAPFESPLHNIDRICTTALISGGEMGSMVIILDSAIQLFASVISNW